MTASQHPGEGRTTHESAGRQSWATRRAAGWQPQSVRREQEALDKLRDAATTTLMQARFGRDLIRLAEWCVSTCLAGGSSVHTAYLVAGTFTEGIAQEWAKQEAKP